MEVGATAPAEKDGAVGAAKGLALLVVPENGFAGTVEGTCIDEVEANPLFCAKGFVDAEVIADGAANAVEAAKGLVEAA